MTSSRFRIDLRDDREQMDDFDVIADLERTPSGDLRLTIDGELYLCQDSKDLGAALWVTIHDRLEVAEMRNGR